MLMSRYVAFFIIILTTQFLTIDAFDWLGFFDKWIFGSNSNLAHVTHSRLILEGEAAEKKFVDNEVNKVSRPKILKAQIDQTAVDINKWFEYHQTANFIMRKIAEWALDTLWERREVLKREISNAYEDVDLEPFCHYRYHNNEHETDQVCRRAFQNEFFRHKGWILDEDDREGYKHCSRVSISSLQKNEHNQYRKLVYFREARKCLAYTQKSHEHEASKSYFSVYLISHEVYLRRKQFAYFVFLNRDRDEDTTNTTDEKGRKKQRFKKILKYMKFWEESKVKIAAYIED